MTTFLTIFKNLVEFYSKLLSKLEGLDQIIPDFLQIQAQEDDY